MKTSKIVTSILFGCAAFLMTENLKAVPQVEIMNSGDLDNKSFNFQIRDENNKIVCGQQGILLQHVISPVSCPGLDTAEGNTFKLIAGPQTTTKCAPPVKGGIPFTYEKGQNVTIVAQSASKCRVYAD